jgi:glutamate racemase
MNAKPIGVFDSGVGGLTVFKALRRRLPKERLIYFGDTAHVPYGSKSKEAVTRYALWVGKFLVRQGVKLLVVACNTASALALEDLKRSLGIPVIGVIRPGARAAAQATANRVVGVIATEATIQSRAYERAVREALPRTKVLGVACPLFVPLVEEGWWDHEETRRVAREYLKPVRCSKMDALILGCTHYPLLKGVLRKAAGPRIRLIDSAEEVAREVGERLAQTGSLNTRGPGSSRFFASDGPERFLRLAKRFLGQEVKHVSIQRFD